MTESAICPVCDMEVVSSDSPTSTHNGTTYQFCSDGCKDQFDADSDQFLGA